MSRHVLHLSQMIEYKGGMTVNTTLCRRVQNGGDYNVADTTDQVTCKFCLKQMARSDKWKRWA